MKFLGGVGALGRGIFIKFLDSDSMIWDQFFSLFFNCEVCGILYFPATWILHLKKIFGFSGCVCYAL